MIIGLLEPIPTIMLSINRTANSASASTKTPDNCSRPCKTTMYLARWYPTRPRSKAFKGLPFRKNTLSIMATVYQSSGMDSARTSTAGFLSVFSRRRCTNGDSPSTHGLSCTRPTMAKITWPPAANTSEVGIAACSVALSNRVRMASGGLRSSPPASWLPEEPSSPAARILFFSQWLSSACRVVPCNPAISASRIPPYLSNRSTTSSLASRCAANLISSS
mmetsp:Transcript_3674/g.8608  ORF Transcript_3674/g.8608 Transcript_3674/m.8608 type:complete len:220 (-) Transcript_3674:451-1110(-)